MEDRSNSSLSSSDEFTKHFLLSMMTAAPCCVFFVINGTILFILCSKPKFSQCPRYVLLFNLVLADTVLMALSQILYLLSLFKIHISYPLCGCLTMMSRLTDQISPLTLIFMSLDCSIAVCFPFRHCTLVTLRNTFFVIFLIWTTASFHVLIQIVLLLEFTLDELPDLQMKELCNLMALPLGPQIQMYETTFMYVLFSLSALINLGSFVAVTVVACLASGDKAQTEKMRYTLLVHFIQLGLNLVSVMSVRIFTVVMRCCRLKRLLDGIYVCVVLMPRCLSALSYSLRDPALRPALGFRLCCTLWLRIGRVKIQVLRKRLKSSSVAHTECQ